MKGLKAIIRLFVRGNEKVVEWCARAVATVWACDIVFLVVVYPIFLQKDWNVSSLVQYLSSAVFQAVMLPILAYIADRQERVQKAQFDRIETKIDEAVTLIIHEVKKEKRIDHHIHNLSVKVDDLPQQVVKVALGLLELKRKR